jgi:hypothetical protein
LGHTGVVTLIHFTAAWAEAICGPHRVEVAGAADELGLTVTECDVDTGSEIVRQHRPLNVPAVALDGKPRSLIVGAFPVDTLVERLRPHLDPHA